ncbi:unnamed protein product, partial [marine sediment metagenome]
MHTPPDRGRPTNKKEGNIVSDYEAIINVAEEALSRERYALEAMKRYGVTREGLGLSKEPAVCGTLEDIRANSGL